MRRNKNHLLNIKDPSTYYTFGGFFVPDKKACFGCSLFNSGKPNTPESSKLRGEQHLQTASRRAIIRAVGGSILPDMGTYRVGQR